MSYVGPGLADPVQSLGLLCGPREGAETTWISLPSEVLRSTLRCSRRKCLKLIERNVNDALEDVIFVQERKV
jgi:hypothetical protein